MMYHRGGHYGRRPHHVQEYYDDYGDYGDYGDYYDSEYDDEYDDDYYDDEYAPEQLPHHRGMQDAVQRKYQGYSTHQ